MILIPWTESDVMNNKTPINRVQPVRRFNESIASVSDENFVTAFDIFFQEAKQMIHFEMKPDAVF